MDGGSLTLGLGTVRGGALVPEKEGLDEEYSEAHRTGQLRKNFLWFHRYPFWFPDSKRLLGKTAPNAWCSEKSQPRFNSWVRVGRARGLQRGRIQY